MERLIKWFFRAWPVLWLIPLATGHYLLINLPCFSSSFLCVNNAEVNKLISLILQILGGILILHSIDSNISLFKNKTIFSLIIGWFKAFPFIKREPIRIQAGVGEIKYEAHPAKIRLGRSSETLEEKIENLEQKISWLKEDLDDETKYLKSQIQNIYEHSSDKIAVISKQNNDVNSKLEKVAVGGIKYQVLGVLLLVYGSVISYVA